MDSQVDKLNTQHVITLTIFEFQILAQLQIEITSGLEVHLYRSLSPTGWGIQIRELPA
jgi:hypothetical protein